MRDLQSEKMQMQSFTSCNGSIRTMIASWSVIEHVLAGEQLDTSAEEERWKF